MVHAERFTLNIESWYPKIVNKLTWNWMDVYVPIHTQRVGLSGTTHSPRDVVVCGQCKWSSRKIPSRRKRLEYNLMIVEGWSNKIPESPNCNTDYLSLSSGIYHWAGCNPRWRYTTPTSHNGQWSAIVGNAVLDLELFRKHGGRWGLEGHVRQIDHPNPMWLFTNIYSKHDCHAV